MTVHSVFGISVIICISENGDSCIEAVLLVILTI